MSLLQGFSSAKYKLTYFNFRSLAEPIRYLLYYVGEEFQDVRIEMEDWEKGKIDKTQYLFGRLPILEERLEDGTTAVLSQSFSIVSYLGRKYKLVGGNLLEEHKCDAYSDCLKEILNEIATMYSEEDAKKKLELRAALLTSTIPRYFSVFENDLKESKKRNNAKPNGLIPLVGQNLTWIDFMFANCTEMFEQFMDTTRKDDDVEGHQEKLLDKYPMIKEHQKGVFALEKVKEWRIKRPVTEH